MKASIIATILTHSLALAGGSWDITSFTAPSLGFERSVCVYLPEGYDPAGSINYPVIYWLHSMEHNHMAHNALMMTVLDSMISTGTIPPVILAKPDGSIPPYWGSFFANSQLYGDFEDFVTLDLVDFVQTSYRTIENDDMRCISGHSMGGLASMEIAIRHPDLYRAVAAHAGNLDFEVAGATTIPIVISECSQSTPPYTYEWDNGYFTNAYFTMGGAYSPNSGNPPTYIDFPLDSNGFLIDSVSAVWALHDPAVLAQTLSPSSAPGIYFNCGTDDTTGGIYQSNCSFDALLTSLEIPHQFEEFPGEGHSMSFDNTWAKIEFLMQCMTGIEDDPSLPPPIQLHQVFPNPFSTSTNIAFELPEPGPVRLEVYDLSGRLVETLVDEPMTAGEHSVELDGSGLAAGVYLIRLSTNGCTRVTRAVLLR